MRRPKGGAGADKAAVRIGLPARVTAADVPALHAGVLAAIQAGDAVVLDGLAVERIDSAAAQWLIVCTAAPADGRPGIEPSEALSRSLHMAGLSLEADAVE